MKWKSTMADSRSIIISFLLSRINGTEFKNIKGFRREDGEALIDIIGGFESDANSVLENLMDLYNQRECKLLEAVYILGACDAETYL